MKINFRLQQISLRDIALFLIPLFLFWVVLFIEIPYSLTRYLSPYYPAAFFIVLVLYYLCFRLPDPYGAFAGLLLSMSFFALALSYNWTSGYSDNMMFGGLLPYKDARNYY